MELSRRGFIRLVGAGGGASLAGVIGAGPAFASPAEGRGDTGFVGFVQATGPAGLRVADHGRIVDVHLGTASHVYAGIAGRVTRGSDFRVGDRVLVEGWRRPDGAVAAVAVGSVLTPVSVTVLATDAGRRVVTTDRGVFEVEGTLPDGEPFEGWDGIGPGTTLDGLIWVEPGTRVPHLLIPRAQVAAP